MKRLLASFTVALTLLLATVPVSAYSVFGKACGNGGSTSVACTSNSTSNPIVGPNGILKKATVIVATIAGIAAVIVIIISGFQFVTAGGDAQKVARARGILLGAVIGLAIIIIAQGIISFVITKL